MTLRGRGIYAPGGAWGSTTSRQTAIRWRIMPAGWDECTVTVVVKQNAAVPSFGDVLGGYSNVRFMDRQIEDMLDDRVSSA